MTRVSNAHTVSIAAATTVLANAAAGMSSGQWLQLTGGNLPSGLNLIPANPLGSSGVSTGYATKMARDPDTRRFYFVGCDHGVDDIFFQYDEDLNAWSRLGSVPFGAPTNHGYEHNIWVGASVDRFYTRRTSDSVLQKWGGGASSNFTTIPDPCPANGAYPSAASGMTWFPELGGTNGSIISFMVNSGVTGMVAGIDPVTLAQTVYDSGAVIQNAGGTYHQFAHYSPTHQMVWFGGGNGNPRTWKLSSSGVVTQYANNIPGALGDIGAGNYQCLPVVNPVTGNFVVIKSATVWYDFNPTTGVWSVRPGLPGAWAQVFDAGQPMWGTIACPLYAPYNVVVFVKQPSGSTAQMWLWKP